MFSLKDSFSFFCTAKRAAHDSARKGEQSMLDAAEKSLEQFGELDLNQRIEIAHAAFNEVCNDYARELFHLCMQLHSGVKHVEEVNHQQFYKVHMDSYTAHVSITIGDHKNTIYCFRIINRELTFAANGEIGAYDVLQDLLHSNADLPVELIFLLIIVNIYKYLLYLFLLVTL